MPVLTLCTDTGARLGCNPLRRTPWVTVRLACQQVYTPRRLRVPPGAPVLNLGLALSSQPQLHSSTPPCFLVSFARPAAFEPLAVLKQLPSSPFNSWLLQVWFTQLCRFPFQAVLSLTLLPARITFTWGIFRGKRGVFYYFNFIHYVFSLTY